MKANKENLDAFIAEQKERFSKHLKADVGFEWDEDWASSTNIKEGLFSCSTKSITKDNNVGRIPETADWGFYEKKYTLNDEFYEFMKAYAVSRYFSNKNMKFYSLSGELVFIKKLFILLSTTIENPRIANINTTHLQALIGSILAHSKVKQIRFTLTHQVTLLIRILSEHGLTLTHINGDEVVRYINTVKTEGQRGDSAAEDASELDDDDDVEMITIRTFLNIIKLRGLVETVGQKVVLNLLLLLIVTGFRGISEGTRLTVDSLRRREVEDPELHRQLTEKGLKTYYLGIHYHAAKNGKYAWRTHWVEPVAIDLVEMIYEDTLRLTQPLRDSVIGFKNGDPLCFLPAHLKSKAEISSIEIMSALKLNPLKLHHKSGEFNRYSFCSWQIGMNRNTTPSRSEKKAINGRHLRVDHYSAHDANTLIAPYKRTGQQEQKLKESFQHSDKHSGTLNIEHALFIIPKNGCNNAAAHIRESLGAAMPIFTTVPSFIRQDEFDIFLKGQTTREDRSDIKSVFEAYGLLENEDGECSQIRSHLPRHNKNTFLAIAGISDHLQAIMMGRKNMEQNKHYHHLAIEEKAKASSVVVHSKEIDFNRPTLDELDADTTPVDAVKETATMSLDEKLSLDNKLKQMLGSSTTKHDKVELMLDMMLAEEDEEEAGFSHGLFEAASKLDTVAEKKSFLGTHGELTQLDLGACQRDVARLGCPYSHRCQDGKPCPYFTLTGRLDEPAKLKAKIEKNESNLQALISLWASQAISEEQYIELEAELGEIGETLNDLKRRSDRLEFRKAPIDLLEMDEHKKPKTLATLFALEHRQRNDDSKKLKDDVAGQVTGD
ncbi:hypothetical protein [Vibrio astriarenae]|uniref:hypothetical protein n=1 Tax=Vibrio astriarenae TaxID=1481923 RepID=UPI0037366C46